MPQIHNGILLVDVGTPKELTKDSVQTYLNEFLGDPFVIRGPRWIREILFKKLIIPLRAGKSLEKYRKIWTAEGSPLRTEAQKVAEILDWELRNSRPDEKWTVRYAFHYGGPDIEIVLTQMKEAGVQDLVIVPLYPQWALSTRGSLEDRLKQIGVYQSEDQGYGFDRVSITPIFFDHEGFIQAQAELLNQYLPKVVDDEVAVVYSFHGLPESHITAVVPSCKKCLRRSSGDCRPNPQVRPYCYRYQCFETAKRISEKLSLFHWDVAFQSRLGPTKWLEPSLIDVTDHLLEQGISTMVVQCPSFVFDCLETLEEVGQEVRDHFLSHGGKEFILVPALNHSPEWLKVLKCMILEQMGVKYETCASTETAASQRSDSPFSL